MQGICSNNRQYVEHLPHLQAKGKYVGENELFFVQLPTLLPGGKGNKPEDMMVEEAPKKADNPTQRRKWEDEFGGTIADIPGLLGIVHC